MVRRPAAGHQFDDRAMDRVDDLRHGLGVEARDRRVAAHAAGVRPLVAVEDPLVVLGGGQRDHVLAVAQGQQRELLALEELLEHDLGGAEAALDEERLDRLAGLGLALADDHALPRSEAVGLQHHGVGDGGKLLERLGPAAQHRVARGRDPGLGHQRLGVHLRALQPGGLGTGSERRDPLGLERVDEPGDQGRLRPDDHQVARLTLGRPDDLSDLGRDLEAPGVGRDPGVARRAEQLGTLAAARQGAHDRVLAAARADDEDLHASSCSRAAAITAACSGPPLTGTG